MKQFNPILILSFLLLISAQAFGSDYTIDIKDPNDRSKSLFRVRTSDGAIQRMSEIQLPLTSGYIGSTTTAFIGVVTASTAPGLEATASDAMFLDWADGETNFWICSVRVPVDYVSGGRIIFEAKSETNVSTSTSVLVYGSVNGGAHVSDSATVDSATFADENIDIVTGNLTLTPGDDFTFIITRDDSAGTGTGTLNIKNVVFRCNDSIDD